MTDPRNIAHDKKVLQEKKHRHEEAPHSTHAVQPGKKPHLAPTEVTEVAAPEPGPAEAEPGQT